MKRITASYLFFVLASCGVLATALMDYPQDALNTPVNAAQQHSLNKTFPNTEHQDH